MNKQGEGLSGQHSRSIHWTIRLLLLAAAVVSWTVSRAAEFEFVVIGDTRPRFESENFRTFENLIARINSLGPAFVINVGDLIYGYGLPSKERQWDHYQNVIKGFHVPYYQLPGNHDTHSKEARRIYGRRFGKFYQSFDYADCHFVLLDNTESQRWGFMGSQELQWLTADLKATQARSVFVFCHFPVWEPERVTPAYFDFWTQKLHPLFKQYRVRAVFGGHYHSYGPSREFDGIRYFITGGGGAELRPEYRKSGGEHHFMRVKVSPDNLQVRVVTEHGELSDSEADVMGGLQFADRHSSRIALKGTPQDLKAGVPVSVTLDNPYVEHLIGTADWVYDAAAFAVEPPTTRVEVLPNGAQQFHFTLKALKDTPALQSTPRLEFNVVSGRTRHRFHRDVHFIQELPTPFHWTAPASKDWQAQWAGAPELTLSPGTKQEARVRAFYDPDHLHLSVSVPSMQNDEPEESAFVDDLQIGMARRRTDNDFGGDFLRLGFSRASPEASNRTPGRKKEAPVPGVSTVCNVRGEQERFDITVPLRLLRHLRSGGETQLLLNLSFPVPEEEAAPEAPVPAVNTFSYRVRYGSDSLVPVHFIELNLERKR